MPPIFHTDDKESFWALGPLKEHNEGDRACQSDGHGYVGQNMNGQVLMCVREMLRKHYESAAPPHRVRPEDRSPDDLGRYFEGYQKALRCLGLLGVGKADSEAPLPAGTLIDKRYRVLEHRVTSGLGCYARYYSYICADEMPVAQPLQTRVRELIQQSVSANLRGKLERLQLALCNESAESNVDKEWDEVNIQVNWNVPCVERDAIYCCWSPAGLDPHLGIILTLIWRT